MMTLIAGTELEPYEIVTRKGRSESGDGSHAETGVGELSTRNHGLENFDDSLYPYESDGSQTTKNTQFTGEVFW